MPAKQLKRDKSNLTKSRKEIQPEYTFDKLIQSQEISQEIPKVTKKKFTLDNLIQKQVLGVGNFGTVKLVQDKISNEYLAMKILPKIRIGSDKQIQHVMNEKNICQFLTTDSSSETQNPFVVSFQESLQDAKNLYLIFEFLNGGELLKKLRRQLSLQLQDATFYLAEVLLAIENLHNQNILYRDLKPENILLDQHGHIKLIDFGFALKLKDLKKERTRTNCGTAAYAAPEILMGTSYGYKADIWSFGILMCELIGGFTPFGAKAAEI